MKSRDPRGKDTPVPNLVVETKKWSRAKAFPNHDLATLEAFLDLFPPQDRHIYWPVSEKGEDKGSLVTVMKPMRATRVLKAFSSGPELVGAPFGPSTWYGVIDLDTHSPYHNVKDLQLLLAVLEDAGVPGTAVQSGLSGGWWVIVPFPQPVDSYKLGDMLEACCRKAGLTMGRGLCEVYPHREVPSQSVRLPGQLGFGPLDPYSGEPVWTVEPEDRPRGVNFILRLRRTAAGKLDLRRKPRVKALAKRPVRAPKPEGATNHVERIRAGEYYFQHGLVEGISRHEATMCVQAYLFATLGGESGKDEQLKALNRWIAEKHNGLSDDWLKRPKQVLKEHQRMVNWKPRTSKTPRASASAPKEWVKHSRQKSEAAIHQLCLAASMLEAYGVKPTYRLLQLLTGCSPTTVAKHRKIWENAPRNEIAKKEITRAMAESTPTTHDNGSIPEAVLDRFRVVVLHSEPGTVDWVGNLDTSTGEVLDVVPVIKSSDPKVIGDVFLRDIGRDLRTGVSQPDVFTGDPVPDDTAPAAGSSAEERMKVLRARMVTKVLVGRKFEKENRLKLLILLVRTLRANYPKLASKIELNNWRVTYLGHTLLRGTTDFDPADPFKTVEELGKFLGETYLKMELNLIRRRPDMAGEERFAA